MTRLTDEELQRATDLLDPLWGAEYGQDRAELAVLGMRLIAEIRAARAAALSEEERAGLGVVLDSLVFDEVDDDETDPRRPAVAALRKLLGDAK